MKEFRLLKLYAQNYKNIKKVELELDPETNMFVGPNGFGKSTIASMITDVLFGRNIKGEAIFNRIPRNGEGALIYFDSKLKNQEQRIFIKLTTLIDNKEYELMKEYTNEGRLKSYYVGDTKHTKKQFDEFVKMNISPLDIFKVCTDVWYFTRDLTKDKQERAIKEVIELPTDLEIFKILKDNGYESTIEFTEELLGNPSKLKPAKTLEDIYDKYSNMLENAKNEMEKRNVAIETTDESIASFEGEVQEEDTSKINIALDVVKEDILNLNEKQKVNESNSRKRNQLELKIKELKSSKFLLEQKSNINPYDEKVREIENYIVGLASDKETISTKFGEAADEEVRLKKVVVEYAPSKEQINYGKTYHDLLTSKSEFVETDYLKGLHDTYKQLNDKVITKETFDFGEVKDSETCILCDSVITLTKEVIDHNKNKIYQKALNDHSIEVDQAKRIYDIQLVNEKSSFDTKLSNAKSLLDNQVSLDETNFKRLSENHKQELVSSSVKLDNLQTDFTSNKLDIEAKQESLTEMIGFRDTYTGETSEIKKIDIDILDKEKELELVPENVELSNLSDLVEKERQLKDRLGNETTISQLKTQRETYQKEIVNFTKEFTLSENVLVDVRNFVNEQFNIINIEVAKDLPTIRIKTVEPKVEGFGFKRVFKILKDGKEYSELSDGEQLTVALELLNFFNKKHNVKLPIISDALETITSDINFKNIQALIFKADSSKHSKLIQYDKNNGGREVVLQYFNEPILKKEIVYEFVGGEK